MMRQAAKKKSRMGKPLGTKNDYHKVRRRQGDIAHQRELRFRFASESERAFVEEAARLETPDGNSRVLPRFLASAALEKAERVTGRTRPLLPIEPAQVSA